MKYKSLLPLLCIAALSVFATPAISSDGVIRHAVADDEEPEPTPCLRLQTETEEAYYADFATALKDANKAPAATLTLLQDVTFGGQAPAQNVRTNLTIDLNGYTLGDTLSGTTLLTLNADTLTLSIVSSKQGGKLRAVRDFNGKIYLISAYRGSVVLDGITVEARNLGRYEAVTYDKLGVTALSFSAPATVRIANCRVVAQCEGSTTCISSAGNQETAAKVSVRDCTVEATGRQNVYGLNIYSTSEVSRCNVQVQATGNGAYGISVTNFQDTTTHADTEIAISKVKVTAQGGYNVYGLNLKAPTALIEDTITAVCDSLNAYSVYANYPVEIEKCRLVAQALQSNAIGVNGVSYSANCSDAQRPVIVRDCDIKVTAGQKSYGAMIKEATQIRRCHITSHASFDNALGVYLPTRKEVEQKSAISDCDITAEAGYNKANGVYLESQCPYELTGSMVSATAGCTHSQAVYLGRNSSLTVEDCRLRALARMDTITRTTESQVRGFVSGDESRVTMRRCHVYSEAQNEKAANNVYGLSLKGRSTVDSTYVKSVSAQNAAYGIYTTRCVSLNTDTIEATAQGNKALALDINGDSLTSYCRHSSFSALAAGTMARGASLTKSMLEMTDCYLSANARMDTFRITTDADVHALHLNTDTKATLRRCNIQAESLNTRASEKVYSVFSLGGAELDSCLLYARSAYDEAYNIRAGISHETTLRDCKLRAFARLNDAVALKNTAAVGKLRFYGGFYSNATNLQMYLPSDTCGIYEIRKGKEYDEGYRYTIRPLTDPGVEIFHVYDNTAPKQPVGSFLNLAQALDFCTGQPDKQLTVVQTADYQLLGGDYTIPANTTLLLPYQREQTQAIGEIAIRDRQYNKQTCSLRLRLDSGVRLHVYGRLEVSALQRASDPGAGGVSGEYALLDMADGAKITLYKGAKMMAWGYVVGDGMVEALDGSEVYEGMQLSDWKGATMTVQMYQNPQRVFPLTHYFYQNIESRVVYHAGANAFGSMSEVAADMLIPFDKISILGQENALFILDATHDTGTTVMKQYDAPHDRIIWTTNGNVSIGELDIVLPDEMFEGFNFRSSEYVLPLNTNMTIIAQSGVLSMKHDVVMLPGTEVVVMPEAAFIVPEGVRLYLYDLNEWVGFDGRLYYTVSYSPSWQTCPRTQADLRSALLDVQGRVEVRGELYATQSGADIISSTASGEVLFRADAGAQSVIYQVVGVPTDFDYHSTVAVAAPLRNADGTIMPTTDAYAGNRFVYTNGRWQVDYGDKLRARFFDFDLRLLHTDYVGYGEVPQFRAQQPERPDDGEFTYTFAGWQPEVSAITVPTDYYAVYSATPKQQDAPAVEGTTSKPRLVLIDGTLYILTPNYQLYNLQGQKVMDI